MHYGKQYIDNDDVQAVIGALKSDYLTTGPFVDAFEHAITKYLGTEYCVAVGNATQGLHIAYQALGIRPGDEVITTPNTFVATTNMLLALGAIPVFVDIDEDTYNIDTSKIEQAITKKTKAIIPVHFSGQPVDMEKIWDLAKKYNLKVIEDAAHAFGAKYKDTYIGAGKSDAVVFSFHPVKPFTTAEGGAIVTNNKDIYDTLRLLRSHGITKDAQGYNDMTKFGYNYRITDLQCALGMSQLKKIDRFLDKRNEIAGLYDNLLKENAYIVTPSILDDVYSGRHLYVIRVPSRRIRDTLFIKLKEYDYHLQLHYIPVYKNSYYKENGYKDINLTETDMYYDTCLSLPIYYELTDEEIRNFVLVFEEELGKLI